MFWKKKEILEVKEKAKDLEYYLSQCCCGELLDESKQLISYPAEAWLDARKWLLKHKVV